MPTQSEYLMGEVIDDPENEEKKGEDFLMGFLKSLIDEQIGSGTENS